MLPGALAAVAELAYLSIMHGAQIGTTDGRVAAQRAPHRSNFRHVQRECLQPII